MNEIIDRLYSIITASPYLPILAYRAPTIGLVIDNSRFALNLAYSGVSTIVQIDQIESFDCIISMPSNQIGDDIVNKYEITLNNLPLRFSRLISRILSHSYDCATDREAIEIIYPSLFIDGDPVTVYTVDTPHVSVLQYRNVWDNKNVYVSNGLTNFGLHDDTTSHLYNSTKFAGYGYELIFVTTLDWTSTIVQRFLRVVEYTVLERMHFFPNEIINIDIDDNRYVGFFVKEPKSFPLEFPITDKKAIFHLVVPITASERIQARSLGPDKFKSELEAHGIIDVR